MEEKLEKFQASKLQLDDLDAHPECAADCSRNAQGSCVVAKPGKVESDLQPKVLRDLAWTCKENIYCKENSGHQGAEDQKSSEPKTSAASQGLVCDEGGRPDEKRFKGSLATF